MRFFYALIIFFGFTQLSFSQSLEITPIEGNSILRNKAVKEERKLKKLYDYQDSPELQRTVVGSCPEFFNFNLVQAESLIFVSLDTFGMGGGNIGDSLFFTLCTPLEYGSFGGVSGVDFLYQANNNIEASGLGMAVDTVCLTFHRDKPGLLDTLLKYPVTIKRRGVTNLLPEVNVSPRAVTQFSLPNSSINFPTPIACSELINIEDPLYDGEGVDGQWESFLSYVFPDTRINYGSNKHPGVDIIAMILCDEIGICDSFLIPFVIPTDRLEPNSTVQEVFFDDFAYDGHRPNPDLWLDRMVYKNNTLAYNPPSIGVVTFDGLDHRGREYDIEFEGIGDLLTSKPIDMSGFDEDDNFTFRFFAQRKGLGLAPSFADSLYLEFKDKDSIWVYQAGFTGYINQVSSDSLEAFQFSLIEMDDDDYFHKDFQFRFVARTSPAGVYDQWHIDYVSLDRNGFTDQTFRDIAFINPPTKLLKDYSHLPVRHLKANLDLELLDTVGGVFFNHNNVQDISLNAATNVNYVEKNAATDFNSNFPLAASGASNNLFAQIRDTVFTNIPTAQFSGIKSTIEGFSDDANLEIISTFSYNDPGNSFNNKFENDVITLSTRLDSIFAYDDGTAEAQAFFKGVNGGELFAVRYHANVDDVITGIQINFPHVNEDVEDQEFRFQIWTGGLEDSDLAFQSALLNPFYLNDLLFLDTLEGFTTYRLLTENGNDTTINITGGQDFYIGFVQESSVEKGIPIGVDLNNPRKVGDILVRLSPDFQFASFDNSGSFMIRPIVGNGLPDNSTSNVIDTRLINEVMNIYPNPTTNRIFIDLFEGQFNDYRVSIYNNVGQLLKEQILENELQLNNYANGIYFMKIDNSKTRENFRHKIVISH